MNRTIVALALQALVGQRRIWVLLGFPVALLALAAALPALGAGPAAYDVIPHLAFPIVLPLVALFATSTVLGPEVDDGSIVYLLATPINRHVVAFSKYVVAWVATVVAGVLPLILAGMLLDSGSRPRSLAWGVGALVAATAYTAVFLALSAATRHAVVAGLLFVLLWESMLGGLLDGIAWVSIRQWGAAVAASRHSWIGGPDLPVAYALGAAAVVTVVGVWFAGDRLRSFTPREGA